MTAMKTPSKSRASNQGSSLAVVMIMLMILTMITASMISFSASERKANEFQRVVLRARNMAENSVNYATAQLAAKLKRRHINTAFKYSPTASIPDRKLYLPTAADTPGILATENTFGTIDVHAAVTDPGVNLTYIDPNDPANATNPYLNLSIVPTRATVIGSAKISRRFLLPYTAYAKQELYIAAIPLFQYAIFYNLDLEFGPGADMIIEGPVHANGDFIARNQDSKSNTVQFKDRVTATGGFYANVTKRGAIYSSDGSTDNNTGGDGPLLFQSTSGTVTDIRASNSAPTTYRDYTMSSDAASAATASTINQFKSWAKTTYAGNFRLGIHGVDTVKLPGVEELENNSRVNAARATIEPAYTTDDAALVDWKFSRHAGLYIVVNPTAQDRTGIVPDATTRSIPAYSYRCWLNSINSDGTHNLTEVVLPGQPSYWSTGAGRMIKNQLPNRFTNLTAIGSNQVIRIPVANQVTTPASLLGDPQDWYTADELWPDLSANATTVGAAIPLASITNCTAIKGLDTGVQCMRLPGYATHFNTLTKFTDAFFFDLRRADGNNGNPAARGTTTFAPRAISKIDFDMTRFRLTVERTLSGLATSSAIYNPNVPTATNWANNILNPSATTQTYNLGPRTGTSPNFRYDIFPLFGGRIVSNPFGIYKATDRNVIPVVVTSNELLDISTSTTPWYDGIAVYIHSVDAEDRSTTAGVRNRNDSAVRLINGRGPVVSANTTDANRNGFSLCTNDALYIMGHFNANGTVQNNSTTTGYGGYSARYGDSATEKLCSIMADAITVLSQPKFAFDSSNASYYQTGGWSDWLSANSFRSGSGWSASWQTTNPSGSNVYDGITGSIKFGHMPYFGTMTITGTPTYTPYNTLSSSSSPEIASNGLMADGAATIAAYQYYDTGTIPNRTTKFNATDTEVSSCLLVGIVETRSSTYPRERELVSGAHTGSLLSYQPSGYQNSGGVHNFPRMLEDWTTSNVGLYIRGSMVAMFQSQVACEPWLATRIYSAPDRYWGLHDDLRAQNASTGRHHVPLEPVLINISRWHYAEMKAADYATAAASIEALP